MNSTVKIVLVVICLLVAVLSFWMLMKFKSLIKNKEGKSDQEINALAKKYIFISLSALATLIVLTIFLVLKYLK